jgi:transposase
MPSDLERCVEAQSMRDVHRLRGRQGDVDRADALDRILHELVAKGTKVPKAPYVRD